MPDTRPGMFVHYKGGVYFLHGISTVDDTGAQVAVYSNAEGAMFTRTFEEFFGMVEVNGESVRRFRKVQDRLSLKAILG